MELVRYISECVRPQRGFGPFREPGVAAAAAAGRCFWSKTACGRGEFNAEILGGNDEAKADVFVSSARHG